MTAEDISAQAEVVMDILMEFYPEYEHIFIYDNAPTHLKCPEGSLSARRMPKNIPKDGHNWGIEVTKRDNEGKAIHLPNGSLVKEKIKMRDAEFNGSCQPLYFPEGHARAGVFKGMAVILEERSLIEEAKLCAECKGFKCMPPTINCCCCRVLYNQPDFVHVTTILENTCNTRGFRVIYLPKFHCELNFIEQCWGYAKRIYWLNPPSPCEDLLKKNVIAALDCIPLATMQRCVYFTRFVISLILTL